MSRHSGFSGPMYESRMSCIYVRAVTFRDMVLFFDLAGAISLDSLSLAFKFAVASSLLKPSCSCNGVEN
jgi:hypothetical protein